MWGRKPTPEKIKEIVKQSIDIDLTDDEARTVADDTIKKLDPYNYNYDYLHSLGFVLRPYLRVGWGSQTHTASPLFLFGSGPVFLCRLVGNEREYNVLIWRRRQVHFLRDGLESDDRCGNSIVGLADLHGHEGRAQVEVGAKATMMGR